MSAIQCHNRFSVLLLFFLLVVLGISACSYIPKYKDGELGPSYPTPQSVPICTYRIVNTYAHDRAAFTEGLVFENGFIYEGTGLYGNSSIRKVDLETGEVLQINKLPDIYFGEGITICGDKLVQLTWQSKVGLVYDKNTLRLIRDFTYDTEGWGITYDGKRLIMSDGTSILYFLDPGTFTINGYIKVYDQGSPLTRLNELEFINGQVYANIWPTNKIAIIDPSNGHVTGWIDLSGLLASRQSTKPIDVLNGIAYDAENDRLFVTGKLWPWLFEIKLIQNQASAR